MSSSEKPLVILDPFPRKLEDIFSKSAFADLAACSNLLIHDDGKSSMPDQEIDAHIHEVVLIIGQPDLYAGRLSKASNLRAIINVETNFYPNVDYDFCAKNGIHVLTPGSAFAPVVAELSLAMAIDLARGITSSDGRFRQGNEKYGLDSNTNSFSLLNAPVGIIGYGDLGRKLHSLIEPFGGRVRVFDPWLPDYYLKGQGVEPESLEGLLGSSRFVFIFASVTSQNEGFIDRNMLGLIPDNSVVLLMSRAAVVNWSDLVAEASSGRLRVGTDVFPEEPVSKDDPVRKVGNMLFSTHRAGAMREALLDIGDQTVADAKLVLQRLPPVVCRRAIPETVNMSRSKPVEKS